MCKTHSKESDIPPLCDSGSSVECHSSVVDSACDARQNRPRLIPSRTEFVTAALPSLHYKRLVLTYKVLLSFS